MIKIQISELKNLPIIQVVIKHKKRCSALSVKEVELKALMQIL